MHNPAYTSCKTSGQIWLDSPRLNETGCYSGAELGGMVKMENLDLQNYRENGLCIRYKEDVYQEMTGTA